MSAPRPLTDAHYHILVVLSQLERQRAEAAESSNVEQQAAVLRALTAVGRAKKALESATEVLAEEAELFPLTTPDFHLL